MRKLIAIGVIATLVIGLGACQTPEERAVGGALLGGAGGAALGGAISGRGSGAAAGGIIGAVGGALVGANTAPQP